MYELLFDYEHAKKALACYAEHNLFMKSISGKKLRTF